MRVNYLILNWWIRFKPIHLFVHRIRQSNEIRLQWVPLHRHRVAPTRSFDVSAPANWHRVPRHLLGANTSWMDVSQIDFHPRGGSGAALLWTEADNDLSFLGQENCGHMRIDLDILTPFDILWSPRNSYILVSLPLMARWHSSKRFNAERILRQSGKFDYSTPQFFHTYNKYIFLMNIGTR